MLYPNRSSRQQRFWSARNEDLSSGVHHSDEPDRISKRRQDVVVQSVQVVLCIGKKNGLNGESSVTISQIRAPSAFSSAVR
jgi:hypothetical protein